MPQSRRNTARSRDAMEGDLKAEDRQEIKISCPRYINAQISEEAKRLGTNRSDVLAILWEYYNFEYPDLLVRRIKDRYLQGLTPTEIAGLSVLYSFLGYINDRTGMLN